MDDEHRSPYVSITNNLQWKQCHNYNHFGLINAYFTKFCLPNLLLNGHYNTSFHVIIINMYYWIMV
jgi:hypothetical protein